MSDIKVSVIIPVYNVEDYLRECIDSVVSQSLREIEIICVNDGSTDNSRDILNQYATADKRVRVITQNNQGLSVARNTGMRYVRGEFTYFLDSDDYIVEGALELLYTISKQKKLDILVFSAQDFYEYSNCENERKAEVNDYKHIKFVDIVVSGRELMRRMIEVNEFRASACLQFFLSDFIKRTNIAFIDGMLHEDEAFTPLVLRKANRAMCISDTLYMRRIRNGSIMTVTKTHRNFEGYFIGMIILIETAIREQKTTGEYEEGIMERIHVLHRACKDIYNMLDMKERSLILSNKPQIFMFIFEKMQFDIVLVDNHINELQRKLDIVKENSFKKIARVIYEGAKDRKRDRKVR